MINGRRKLPKRKIKKRLYKNKRGKAAANTHNNTLHTQGESNGNGKGKKRATKSLEKKKVLPAGDGAETATTVFGDTRRGSYKPTKSRPTPHED